MKTICIYHSRDLDGWMSGAIVKHWFIKTNSHYYILNENGSIDKTAPGISDNLLHFLGWDYGDPIPDLSEYDEVIMCDVSFPVEVMIELQSKDFIYIDHHISAIKQLPNGFTAKGFLETNFAACELTWKYFFPEKEMPEIVRLLGRYDCFGHKQQWKQVVSYEGYYEVSNQGNVRSIDRSVTETNTNKIKELQGKDLSIANSKRGYRVVNLFKDNKGTLKNVHQLVAEAFIPNPDNKPCINHKDFNRLNNYVSNLEWCTYAENNLHSIEEGKRGKIVLQFTKENEFVQQFDSIKRAELHTGIASQNIGKVCKGEREFAGEYRWEYGIDKDIISQFVPDNEEQKVLEFQYGARQVISNYEDAYTYLKRSIEAHKVILKHLPENFEGEINQSYPIEETIQKEGSIIYQYLYSEAKQIYSKAFDIEILGYKFKCANIGGFNPSSFNLPFTKDGYDGFVSFVYSNSKKSWTFTLRSETIDVSTIAKQYGGGGHKGAAGFVCNNETMLKIINNE